MASEKVSKPKRPRLISRRAIGSTVFSIIDYDREYYGDELEGLVRDEVSNWLSRYDGYEIYAVNILEQQEGNYLGTVLVINEASLVGSTDKLTRNPDLWDIDIYEKFQGTFRFVQGTL